MLAILIYYKLFYYKLLYYSDLLQVHIIADVPKTITNRFLRQGVTETDFTITTNEDKKCGCKEPDDISTTMHLS